MNNPNPSRPYRFHGMMQIARFNWPRYVAGVAFILIVGGWLIFSAPGGWLRFPAWVAVFLAAWWSIASLIVSHWVYDVSELYRWTWIPSALPARPVHWLHLHAGLDESSGALHQLFPGTTSHTCDFFDAAEMSEPSIQRARDEANAPSPESINFRKFPFPNNAFDTVFILFAAHEIRQAASREAFFHEIHRVLAPDGTVLLVEHARDLMNFAAFGPGFLHFLTANEWRRLAKCVGLQVVTEKRMTPFVRIIQLKRTA